MRHLILVLLILLPTLFWGAERLAVLNIERAKKYPPLTIDNRSIAKQHT